MKAQAAPSIADRVGRALLLWALLWGAALALAAWLQVTHEVEELFDDTLEAAAEQVMALLPPEGSPRPPRLEPPASAPVASGRFMWQLVLHDAGARVLDRSSAAPVLPLHATATAGFSDVAGWRVYGTVLGPAGRMLYVAQTREERADTGAEVLLAVLAATVPMAVLALLWLRLRVRHELRPLQALSQRLLTHDPMAHAQDTGATLGPAERRELQPVHDAIDTLATRLARRVAQEQAFSAHAAHALRTPLAGIDAQLAVAQREAGDDPALAPRLKRVRSAAARLQRVVGALLTLFRSGIDVQREPLHVPTLLGHAPIDGLTLHAQASHPLHGDAGLLTAALLNLLDNSQRAGATQAWLDTPAPHTLRLRDNGPGVATERRATLRAALARQDDGSVQGIGLGLRLAELVARAHGGQLLLPDGPDGPAGEPGFTVELRLPPPP